MTNIVWIYVNDSTPTHFDFKRIVVSLKRFIEYFFVAGFILTLKSATLLKSQSVAAQTAKNAIFLVWTDFLPCVG